MPRQVAPLFQSMYPALVLAALAGAAAWSFAHDTRRHAHDDLHHQALVQEMEAAPAPAQQPEPEINSLRF